LNSKWLILALVEFGRLHVLDPLGHKVSIETSGSFWKKVPNEVWITLSPKEHLNKKYSVKEQFWDRANKLKSVIKEPEDSLYY